MANPYVPTICKVCDAKKREADIAEKAALESAAERAWIVGTMRRVVVSGYTYETDLPVKRGTKVLLPESWLGEVTGKRGPWEGTVTSLISDYTGPCKRIIKICDEAETAAQKNAAPAVKDLESIATQVIERYNLSEQECRELALKLLATAK